MLLNGLSLLVLKNSGLSSMDFSNDSNMLNKTTQILCQIRSFITYVFYTSEFLDRMWYDFIWVKLVDFTSYFQYTTQIST